jgi:hypothetical protein
VRGGRRRSRGGTEREEHDGEVAVERGEVARVVKVEVAGCLDGHDSSGSYV